MRGEGFCLILGFESQSDVNTGLSSVKFSMVGERKV